MSSCLLVSDENSPVATTAAAGEPVSSAVSAAGTAGKPAVAEPSGHTMTVAGPAGKRTRKVTLSLVTEVLAPEIVELVRVILRAASGHAASKVAPAAGAGANTGAGVDGPDASAAVTSELPPPPPQAASVTAENSDAMSSLEFNLILRKSFWPKKEQPSAGQAGSWVKKLKGFELRECGCRSAKSRSQAPGSVTRCKCFADFLIGLELAERIDRPNGCGQPANQGELQDQAENAGERAANGEEGEPGEEEGDEESHGGVSGPVVAGRSKT